MVRFLPPQPDLEHVKNEAKALHKAHRRHRPEVCDVLRHLERLRDADDEQVLAADLRLTDVQFALAMEYGFRSWGELRDVVLSTRPPPGYRAEPERDALILPDPPAGMARLNRFAAAYSMALSYLGAPADYESVLGDSGLAFILQADALHKPHGTGIRQLDIGWWPLDQWGAMLRLDFLDEAYGVPMRRLPGVEPGYRADPALHYGRQHEAEVAAALRAGRPVVAVGEATYVVVGLDGGTPPLLGQVACSAEARVRRLEHFPFEVVVFGEPGRPMDRRRADAEALDFAVRLGRDEVDLSALPGKSSGRRSWELWARQLADEGLCGPHFYHANVVLHLRQSRATAAAYLRDMGNRHAAPISAALAGAATEYDAVVEAARRMGTGAEALSTSAGRAELISLIGECMELEALGQERMAAVLETME